MRKPVFVRAWWRRDTRSGGRCSRPQRVPRRSPMRRDAEPIFSSTSALFEVRLYFHFTTYLSPYLESWLYFKYFPMYLQNQFTM
ncbi:unnamed protein product [Amoebophrya sp. A120]|nr:unnamed protein product [Amoebophrya sp. A120]|eukprot:GSA120T00012292001.1